MGKSNFSEDFKRDAVRQITERGYPVAADDVPPSAGPSQRILHLAEEPAEQAGQRGQATDRSAAEGGSSIRRHRSEVFRLAKLEFKMIA